MLAFGIVLAFADEILVEPVSLFDLETNADFVDFLNRIFEQIPCSKPRDPECCPGIENKYRQEPIRGFGKRRAELSWDSAACNYSGSLRIAFKHFLYFDLLFFD